MVSANTLCKNVLNVKNTVIENFNLYSDEDGVKHIRIKSRPNKWHENDCPFCHKSCPAYDKHSSRPTTWRGLDWGGILVEVEYQTHRIICLEHGVICCRSSMGISRQQIYQGFRPYRCMVCILSSKKYHIILHESGLGNCRPLCQSRSSRFRTRAFKKARWSG